jgi:hypothetical protein
MPFRASPDRQLPSAEGLSRQRIANKQPRGPTAVSGDQASDLVLPGSGGRI